MKREGWSVEISKEEENEMGGGFMEGKMGEVHVVISGEGVTENWVSSCRWELQSSTPTTCN